MQAPGIFAQAGFRPIEGVVGPTAWEYPKDPAYYHLALIDDPVYQLTVFRYDSPTGWHQHKVERGTLDQVEAAWVAFTLTGSWQ